MWVLFPIMLLLAACDHWGSPEDNVIDCTANPVFTLGYGDTADCGDWSVTFTGDIEDSRCPTSVTCIWAGRVDVQLQLGDDLISLGLPDSPEQGRSRDTVGNQVIELLEVLPVPVVAGEIPKKDYLIKLEVSAL